MLSPTVFANPAEWQEKVRVGLLKTAYGWQSSPLLPQNDAARLYSEWYGKPIKNNCLTAKEKDWAAYCRVMYYSGNMITCDFVNPAEKLKIIKTLETSRAGSQYGCLYG